MTVDDPRTMVLIHGTPLSPAVWDDTRRALADRTILVPDCTNVPDHDAQTALAQNIAREVEGELDVVGHSFGGQIAIELALLIPHRVRTLTILCSRDTPYPAFAAVADAVRVGNGPTAEATLARWFTPEDLVEDAGFVDAVRARLDAASVLDWASALDSIATYDRSARTPGIRIPTTVVGAGRDAVSDPPAVTAMAQRIPDAELHIRPDWAHMSPFAHVADLVGLLTRSSAPLHATTGKASR